MNRQKIRLFTVADGILIAGLTAFGGFLFPMLSAADGDTLVVYRDEREIARYPLDKDLIFTVRGVSGDMSIAISSGRAKVASSTCPHGVCMKHSPVSRPRENIVCVPNHVIIEVDKSGPHNDIDAKTF